MLSELPIWILQEEELMVDGDYDYNSDEAGSSSEDEL